MEVGPKINFGIQRWYQVKCYSSWCLLDMMSWASIGVSLRFLLEFGLSGRLLGSNLFRIEFLETE